MAESLKGLILWFQCLQLCQAWLDEPNFYNPALAIKNLSCTGLHLNYAPVEDSLNSLNGLAEEPMVVYTTEPQRP